MYKSHLNTSSTLNCAKLKETTTNCLKDTPKIANRSKCCENSINETTKYGKIKDCKSRAELYSYDYLTRSCQNKLAPIVRDPNEFFYLDKLYNSSRSGCSDSSSLTRARICSHPAPLPNILPRCSSHQSISLARPNCDALATSPNSRQVKFIDDHGLNVNSCGNVECKGDRYLKFGRTYNSETMLPMSGDDQLDNYVYSKPYTNYLEIGKTCNDCDDSGNKDKSVLLLFNKKSNLIYSVNKTATNDNHLLDIQFDKRGYPLY